MLEIGDMVQYHETSDVGLIVDIDVNYYGVIWFNEAINPTNGCYYYTRSEIKKVKRNV
jgi:hypothetical protein